MCCESQGQRALRISHFLERSIGLSLRGPRSRSSRDVPEAREQRITRDFASILSLFPLFPFVERHC
jgi:hypothetical protein